MTEYPKYRLVQFNRAETATPYATEAEAIAALDAWSPSEQYPAAAAERITTEFRGVRRQLVAVTTTLAAKGDPSVLSAYGIEVPHV